MDTLAIPKNVHMFNDNDVCAHCQITRSNASELCQPICWTRVARDRVDEVLRFELHELFQDNMVCWLPDTIHAFEEFSAPHTDEIVRITPVTYGAHGPVSRLIRFIDQTVAKLCRDLREQARPGRSQLYLVWRARPEVYPRMDDRTGKDTGEWCFRMRLGAAWGPAGLELRRQELGLEATGELGPLSNVMRGIMLDYLPDWFEPNAHRVFGFNKHSVGDACVIADPCDVFDRYLLREHTIDVEDGSATAAVQHVSRALRRMIKVAIEGMTESHILVLAEKAPPRFECSNNSVKGRATCIVQAVPANFAPRRTLFYEPHRRKCCRTELTKLHALGCTSPGAISDNNSIAMELGQKHADALVSKHLTSLHAYVVQPGSDGVALRSELHPGSLETIEIDVGPDEKTTCEIELPDGFKTDDLRKRGEERRRIGIEKAKELAAWAQGQRQKDAAAAFEAGMPSFGLAPVKNEGPAFSNSVNPLPEFTSQAVLNAALDLAKDKFRAERVSRNNPPKPVDERPAEAIAAAFALPVPGAITVSDLCATPMPHMLLAEESNTREQE